jgi:Tol biopolymer transport system component
MYWHDNSVVRDISPDRSAILFSEGGQSLTTTTDWDTYLRKVDGSPAIRLGAGLATAFSPDGKWAMTNESGQLRAYPTRAGDVRPLTSGEIRHSGGGWLHDGSRIVFAGNKPGHLLQLWVQDSASSPPRAISSENIEFDRYNDKVVESPDGVNVAAVVPGEGIQLLPIETGAARTIPDTNGFRPITWCQDGDLLIYRTGEVPVKVLRVDPRSGKQRPWKELAPRDRTALGVLGPIRFAPDCETYAYTAQYDPSTLTVLTRVH